VTVAVDWTFVECVVRDLDSEGLDPTALLFAVSALGCVWSDSDDDREVFNGAEIASAFVVDARRIEALCHGRDTGPGTKQRISAFSGLESWEDFEARLEREDQERKAREEEERQERRERYRRESQKACAVPRGQRAGEVRRRLREHRVPRENLAHALRARITNGQARKIVCPKCGKRSVWFHIEPGRMSGAECNHKKSCGWHGALDLLALMSGASANPAASGQRSLL